VSADARCRRRATQLGQIEDWFIFNGTYPSVGPSPGHQAEFEQEGKAGHKGYRPKLAHLNALDITGTPTPIGGVTQDLQLAGMRQRNPGSLGLIEGPRVQREEELAEEAERAEQAAERAKQRAQQAWGKFQLDNDGLMQAIIGAINSLEDNGYVAPYVCVFGRKPFEAAFKSINNSTVLPRDRIEPLIGRELLHASGIDIVPHSFDLYNPNEEEWQSRGVLLSMANEPIDLALAAEATPEFRQVDVKGHYVFSVFERFALRIKDAEAIVPLRFWRS
jgi:hypothetical protein